MKPNSKTKKEAPPIKLSVPFTDTNEPPLQTVFATLEPSKAQPDVSGQWEVDPQARFWVEARVALAKSAVLIASAEAGVAAGNIAPAAVDAYYSLFHLSLALMWMLPESIPKTLHIELAGERDSGNELPNKAISHRKAEQFLCDGQVAIPVENLSRAFKEARELREFSSYGPRVTYKGKQPIVGPCYSTNRVRDLVKGLPALLGEAVAKAGPKTAYKGTAAPIMLDGAMELLTDGQFAFKGWYSPAIIERGKILLKA